MPSRPRPSKVTKPNGSARNRKPLSDEAQQVLEHSNVVANGNSSSHGPVDNPVPLVPGHMALPLPQSNSLSNIGGGDEGDSFIFTTPPQPSPYPVLGPRQYPSAAELAYSKYGDAVKIDSALCKKVAGEQAKRSPTQRRPDQKLNIDRRSNLEALLAHTTGDVADRPCKNCYKGHGPWTECVVYDGQMCGSCTNCWYNASGSRCTFHGNGTATASAASPPAQPPGSVPCGLPTEVSEAGSSQLPYYASPKDDIKPIPGWSTPQHDNESSVSSQSRHQGTESLPVQPPTYMDYHPPPMPHGLPSVDLILGGGHDMATATPWAVSDPTRRLIHQAMGDVAHLSRRDRHIARIETAAEELAMRIAEFNEYMRTPEGLADLHHFHETTGAHMMAPGHTHDARMETMETDSVHSGRTMP